EPASDSGRVTASHGSSTSVARMSRTRAAPLLLAAGVGAGLAVAGTLYLRPPAPRDAATTNFSIEPPRGARLPASTNTVVPGISPDGKHIAFSAFGQNGRALFVRSLDSTETREIILGGAGVEQPFWSPDSSRIGFTENSGGSGTSSQVKAVSVSGGP